MSPSSSPKTPAQLSHVDHSGKVKMVDVAAKDASLREAIASGKVSMKSTTAQLIDEKSLAKGDVINTAVIAGIMAAKKVSALIPLCHPLELTAIDVEIVVDAERGEVNITAKSKSVGKTGVEMEALTAVAVAGLTIYDMCKAVDKEMIIGEIKLLSKKGGKSGVYERKEGKC